MSTPQISLQQANRYLLKRQHLLTPCHDPLLAVVDACGLQAQVPSTPALSLRVRVAGFTRDAYDRMLVEERSLVRTWAMRGTIHTLPSALLPMYTRVYSSGEVTPDMALAMDLLKDGPLTRRQLSDKAMAQLGISSERTSRLFGPWGGILSAMARAGLTVHVPSEGADVPVTRTSDWLGPQPEPPAMAELEDALFRAYAHGYGPVTARDFAHFTNFRMGRVREIIARARGIAEVRLEGARTVAYIPEADLPELLATTGDEPAPVHLLPRFDSLLLAHKDKTRLLDEQWRRNVFREAAQVAATVLLNGRVAGTWRMKATRRDLQFWFSPFGRQPVRAVRAEANRLARWLGLEGATFQQE